MYKYDTGTAGDVDCWLAWSRCGRDALRELYAGFRQRKDTNRDLCSLAAHMHSDCTPTIECQSTGSSSNFLQIGNKILFAAASSSITIIK
jgi:hypothetical protein